jgi:hypothetical protein
VIRAGGPEDLLQACIFCTLCSRSPGEAQDGLELFRLLDGALASRAASACDPLHAPAEVIEVLTIPPKSSVLIWCCSRTVLHGLPTAATAVAAAVATVA